MSEFNQLVTFLYSNNLEASSHFYGELLGLPMVLDQGSCRIYQACANGFIGVCRRGKQSPPSGEHHTVIVTLVSADVDADYARLCQRGLDFEQAPTLNASYNIYHCFLRDPDGYLLEIQRFLDPAWPPVGRSLV